MQNSSNAPLLRLGGQGAEPANEDVAMPISFFFRMTWRLRALVVAVVGAMLLLAGLYLLVRTPDYVATSVIGQPIGNSNPNASAGLSALSMIAGHEFGGGENTFDKYLQLIQAS